MVFGRAARPLLRRLPVARRPRSGRRVLGRHPGQGDAVRRLPGAVHRARRRQPADRRQARRRAASRPTCTRTSSASTSCSAIACASCATLVAGVLALLVALPTTSQWQSWLLFRNSRSFGVSDAQFGADVGFYVFELPFLGFVLDWLFVAMVLVLMITLLAHVLNGGVRVRLADAVGAPGDEGSHRRAPRRARRAQGRRLLGHPLRDHQRAARLRAGRDLRGRQRPAPGADAAGRSIALLTAGAVPVHVAPRLVAAAARSPRRCGSSCSWPAGWSTRRSCSRSSSTPTSSRARRRTSGATSRRRAQAMGIQLDQVADPLGRVRRRSTADEVEADLQPLRDVRLLNPTEMLSRFRIDRGAEAGLSIDDLDVDRYVLDGRRSSRCSSPRASSTSTAARTRAGRAATSSTRAGAGLVMAPVGRVQEQRPARLPDRRPRCGPSCTSARASPATPSPRTDENERACGEDVAVHRHGGVQMSSFVRRAAFALAFLDYNVLGSGAIEDDSQMLWVRNVRDRVHKLAPFLSFDGDPYPVVVDGRVLWVIDAYTTTSRYPYAQRIGNDVQLTRDSGLDRDSNYVRNSVKAVVDAYDGSVRFYVNDPDDPIVAGVAGRLRRPVHAVRRDARRAARAPALPRGPVPGADRHVLEVPARAGGLLRARRRLVGGPGARRRPPRGLRRRRRTATTTDGRADGDRARVGVVDQPLHPVLHDVPRPDRRGSSRVRAAAAVRAVLARRPAHRAAGVHDGVERPGDVRPADGVRGGGQPAPDGPRTVCQPHRLRAVDHPADHAADQAAATACATATCSSCRSPTGCCTSGRSTSRSPRGPTAPRPSPSTAS